VRRSRLSSCNATGRTARAGRNGEQLRRATIPHLGKRARDQHTEALAIARDLGVPLEEAGALEPIGRSYLQDGNRGQADAHLRQALTIYQRSGAPCARQVQETLHRHKLHHHDNLHGADEASEEA
jgi:hypothetical protein